jgi:hypothetical protein
MADSPEEASKGFAHSYPQGNADNDAVDAMSVKASSGVMFFIF